MESCLAFDSLVDEGAKVAFVAGLKLGEAPIIACDSVAADRGAATAWPFEQGYRLDGLEGIIDRHFFAGRYISAGNSSYLVGHPEVGVARMV